MSRKPIFASVALRTLGFALAAGLLPSSPVGGQGFQPPSRQLFTTRGVVSPPVPPPAQPPNLVPLTAAQQLGKDILYDSTLSNPPGLACASCHNPETGFTGPSSSINERTGIMPGIVPGRFGKRKPQSYGYVSFNRVGPAFDAGLGVWIGGEFWDGRAPNEAAQALGPFIGPNEMANVSSNGIYPPHAGGFSTLVVEKIQARPYTPLFREVFGQQIFQSANAEQVYHLITQAIAAYEATAEINQFSSKYDAAILGLARLTPSEARGQALFFGQAQCVQCHTAATLPDVMAKTGGRDPLTMYCYANVGIPRNPANPYYQETNAATNPFGYNPLGFAFVDYGLGSNPNPSPNGTFFYLMNPGDLPAFRGLFKTPSVRNVDKRPDPSFVKAYMHNGVFKSLEEVVHFYNKRNIATNARGQEVVFDLRVGPPPGFTPLLRPRGAGQRAKRRRGRPRPR